MKWRPFNTAPKDRTIFAAYWGTIPFIVMWNDQLGWYHVRDCKPVKHEFNAWAEMSTPNQYEVENAEASARRDQAAFAGPDGCHKIQEEN